jgi:RNA polymerase sigma-70 factor (ECF subfamily)
MLTERLLSAFAVTNELDHIIQGCIKGNRSQQEKLYRMFSSKMFGVCLRYCRNYDDAKDILQDGFIKVFEKIGQFGQRGSFEGWIRRIMINTALERFRRNSHTLTMEKLPDMIDNEEFDEGEVEFSMDELLGYIQKLPERYRMVFNLYVIEEMTHKEVAEVMGITEGTSKSDLSRARAILQNIISNKVKQVAKIG